MILLFNDFQFLPVVTSTYVVCQYKRIEISAGELYGEREDRRTKSLVEYSYVADTCSYFRLESLNLFGTV